MNSHPIWGVSRSQKDKIGKDHIGTHRTQTDLRADIDR